MNFNTPNNTPTWTDAHISRNFSLKLIAHVVGRWLIKCQTLIPIFSLTFSWISSLRMSSLIICWSRILGTNLLLLKIVGFVFFQWHFVKRFDSQKKTGQVERWNMEMNANANFFFDLYYAKILTVFPNGLGTSLQFHKLIPSSMNDPLQKETRSLLFNKSHLTELIKCFLEEKHICQVQLDG